MTIAELALLLSAITALLTVLVAVGNLYLNFKLQQVHTLVNGVSHELAEANRKAAFEEGQVAGVEKEREKPMVPASTLIDAVAAVSGNVTGGT